jgi:Effector-associated domain 5/NACHT domain
VPILSHDDIVRVHIAAVEAGLPLSRIALVAGLPPGLAGSIPIATDHNSQLLVDLHHLNEIEQLSDGGVPLRVWLSNAFVLSRHREESKIFRDALASIDQPSPAIVTTPVAVGEIPDAKPPGLEWLGPWSANPQIDPRAPEVFRVLEMLQAWLFTDEAARALGWGAEAIDSFGLGVAIREWMRREGLWIDRAPRAARAPDNHPAWYAGSGGKPRALCCFDWAHALSGREIRRAGRRLRARAGADHTLLGVIAQRPTDGKERSTFRKDKATGVWVATLIYPETARREAAAPEPALGAVVAPQWLPAGYLAEVKRRCERLDPILGRQERVYNRRIDQAVELTLAYREESTAYPALALLQDAALAARDAVILGDAGSGKTTLVRSLAAQCTEPGSPWIPIYLPLGRYRALGLATLLEQAGLGDCRGADGYVDAGRFADGRFLLLLDGYDELGDPESFWREVSRLRGQATRTIVTGRFPGDLRHRLPHAAFLAVRPLGPDQIEKFIRVFEGDATSDIVTWIRRRGLDREARRPLWLIFILLVLRLRKTELTTPSERPLPLGEIYRLLIEHYFLEQWEAVREGLPLEAPLAIVSDYLAEVALHMGWDRELSVRRARLESLYEARAAHGLGAPFDRFLEQIEGHQLLLYEAGEYFFPHRSFQEYFAALGLKNHIRSDSMANYLDEYWKDTLRLLMGLLPAEQAAEQLEQVALVPHAEDLEPGALHGFGRAEILAEVAGFAGARASSLGPRARMLRRRVEQALGTLAASPALRDAELALRLSLLLPAEHALGYVATLVERSQDVGIDAIDVLGRIFTREALTLAMDRVMRSPDERILRRVADHVLVPHVHRSGAWGAEARSMIEARIRATDRDRQDRKRRWHLVHALLAARDADPERMRSGDSDIDAAMAAYALQESRPGDALAALVRRFDGGGRTTRASTIRALGQLLSSEDFYLRRTGAHFLRIVDFDFTALARRAMSDPAIEVRFSMLKGLIHLAQRWPARRAEASGWLLDAIEEHPEPEEEHFRQVSLGVVKHIDRRRFWPRALAALEHEPVTFRIDIVHGLWDAEGLWAAASVSALDRILADPAEPERLHDEARDAIAALAGRRAG